MQTGKSNGPSRAMIGYPERFVKPISALLFLIFTLSAGSQAYANNSSTSSIPFSVGQCWQVDVAKNVPSLFWNGSGPVNCSKPHNGYTYAVIILPTNYPNPYNDKKSTQDQAIVNKFDLKNHDPLVNFVGNTRVRGAIYFPTKLRWLAGQRWERFDLGIAQFGSPLSPFNKVLWAPLPANAQTVIDGLKKNLLKYRICTNTSKTGDGPAGASAVWADCAGKPMYRYSGVKDIALNVKEKFPGAKIVTQRAMSFCDKLLGQGTPYTFTRPSATGWLPGQTDAYCWARITPARAPAGAAGPYSVGECWNLDQSKNLTSNYWNGSDPVDCQKSHNDYTYGYWGLAKDIKSLPVRGSTVDNSIRDGCTSQTSLANHNDRTTTVIFYPSPKQWAAGERWYRCDVGLYQFGSLYSNPKWSVLPSDMKKMLSDITNKSPLYQLCFKTSVPNVLPNYDPNAVYANCLGKYSYRYLGVAVDLQKEAKEPYPGDSVITARGSAACQHLTPKNGKIRWNSITKSMWDAGNTFVYCWEGS